MLSQCTRASISNKRSIQLSSRIGIARAHALLLVALEAWRSKTLIPRISLFNPLISMLVYLRKHASQSSASQVYLISRLMLLSKCRDCTRCSSRLMPDKQRLTPGPLILATLSSVQMLRSALMTTQSSGRQNQQTSGRTQYALNRLMFMRNRPQKQDSTMQPQMVISDVWSMELVQLWLLWMSSR